MAFLKVSPSKNAVNNELFHVQKQFFSGLNIKNFDWKTALLKCIDEKTGECSQQALLNATVSHPINKRLPVRVQYQLAFLKHIIHYLERNSTDVAAELYEEYCATLNLTEGPDVHHHFFVDDSENPLFSVRETASYISNGTTGLSTWPAARVLAEFCLNNRHLFNNKKIVELGCGTGFLGLSVVFSCKPKEYIFTDCHPAVLNLVESNLKLNGLSNLDNGCAVRVVSLNWEDVALESVRKDVAPESARADALESVRKDVALEPLRDFRADVVLATDVVYDVSIVNSLVTVLKLFAGLERSVRIFVACVVRNEDTFDAFLDAVRDAKGVIAEKAMPDTGVFIHCSMAPVRILEIAF